APSWSPSGAKIAFAQWYLVGDISAGDIEVMSDTGSSRQKVTDDIYDQEWPAWSPDGKHIVFSDEACDYCISFVSPNGANVTRTSVVGTQMDWQRLPTPSYPTPQ